MRDIKATVNVMYKLADADAVITDVTKDDLWSIIIYRNDRTDDECAQVAREFKLGLCMFYDMKSRVQFKICEDYAEFLQIIVEADRHSTELLKEVGIYKQ